MTEREREHHEEEARGYMLNCTDAQLDGVIEVETERLSKVSEGEVAIVARIMRAAARNEKRARGIS